VGGDAVDVDAVEDAIGERCAIFLPLAGGAGLPAGHREGGGLADSGVNALVGW